MWSESVWAESTKFILNEVTVNVPILSANHYWIHFSIKYGPLIQAIRVVKEQGEEKVELLRKDFLNAIKPYIYENELRVGYLLTIGIKA